LKFAKKKTKTKKTIARAKKAMLQYVRRNLRQMRELVETAGRRRKRVYHAVRERLRVAEEIFRQQWEMYKRKTHRIADRIVSLHRPYVRPIKTGKQAKDTEFGAKGALVHVDGFLFLDHLKHEAFNESEFAGAHIRAYRERFGKFPPYVAADQKYGTRENREMTGELGIRFEPESLAGLAGIYTKIKRDPENRSVVQGEAEREESDRRSVREREGTLWTGPGEIYGPRGFGDVGAGRASGDEPEDGTAESIERKPVRVREDLTGSHVGSQDDQSAVEDKIGFFSRPYLTICFYSTTNRFILFMLCSCGGLLFTQGGLSKREWWRE